MPKAPELISKPNLVLNSQALGGEALCHVVCMPPREQSQGLSLVDAWVGKGGGRK